MANVVVAVIGLVIGAASAVNQRKQAKKAQAEQKKQNAIQNRIAKANNAKRVRQAIARNRVEAANQQQAGFSFGVPGSSSVQQSVGAGASDTAGVIKQARVQQGGNEAIAASQNRQASILNKGDPFALIGAGVSLFGNAQNRAAIGGLFS